LIPSNEKIRAVYRNKESIVRTQQFLSYYNLSAQTFSQNVEWVQADVLDIESLKAALVDADTVYNCSGAVSFQKSDKKRMIEVNIKGTANIVNICLENNCKKLIHVSSIAALGETNSTEPITEQTAWVRTANESWYSITKFNAETEVWRGIAEGLSAVIVNPSVIIGPGNWNEGSPKLFQTVANGLRYYTKGTVGFVDVRDVCKAMILLSDSSITNEKFLLSGSNQSYQTLFTAVATVINKPVPTRNATAFILALAWRLDKLRSLLLGKAIVITKSTARTALKQSFYSSKKIETELAFSFREFEDTIAFTGECFLKE
jgi:nucleoside-diphosphate-sugar epimerase